MRTRTLRIVLIVLSVLLGLHSFVIVGHASPGVIPDSQLIPRPIRQGPVQATYAVGSFYWFQSGAIGDSASYNSDGANITIRTVYDQVHSDAHSYWVGTILNTNGFVQVGYLNGLSTTGQPYCCAWFFETFYNPGCDCPPVIGPEGSAGPIGSRHNYSMIHTGGGVWAFYMDGSLLGKSPPPGDTNYLGAGATSSGNQAPAGIAEVAQASDNRDIIGPAEFTNLTIRQSGSWHSMTKGISHVGYGYGSQTGLPNPYGVWEVEGHDNDFLVGSNIRQPASSTTLWPTSVPNAIQTTINFVDHNGGPFSPDWISLQDLRNVGNTLYLTNYNSQSLPQSSSFMINYAYWHAVNVVSDALISTATTSQTVQGNVFSIPVRIIGRFYSLPVSGATVLTFLPDSTNQTVVTDSNGNVTLAQLPPGNYTLRVTVPYGVASVYRAIVAGPVNLSVSVFSIAELLTIIAPPIAAAILVVVIALRREQVRRAAMPPTWPFPMTAPVTNCRACGKPLGPTEYFCITCGTPRANPPQPSPPSQEQAPPPPTPPPEGASSSPPPPSPSQ